MQLIITGSLAYDHIMVFQDKFKKHILPDKIHMLNVAFNVENLQKELGGTAGNIAYTLNLMAEKSCIVGTVGKDFTEYQKKLKKLDLSRDHIKILAEKFTAQCFITTDRDDNQITAFHGGAMFEAHQKKLDRGVVNKSDLVIISPNGIQAMIEHAEFCRNHNIKYIFDPGQSIPAFSGDELQKCIKGAEFLVVNDYEWQMVQDKTNIARENVFDFTKHLIITLGEEGSLLCSKDNAFKIQAAKPKQILDPTGCGDAYRAGLLFALKRGEKIEKCGKVASVSASFAIEQHGTQNHKFTLQDFSARYKETYGEELNHYFS